MQSIRRVLFAVSVFLSAALPASAQMTTTADTGPSLIGVWVWILAAGITIFIVGTCLGQRSSK